MMRPAHGKNLFLGTRSWTLLPSPKKEIKRRSQVFLLDVPGPIRWVHVYANASACIRGMERVPTMEFSQKVRCLRGCLQGVLCWTVMYLLNHGKSSSATLPTQQKSTWLSRVPTHTYAECKISGQQPTQLHKEFPWIHSVGHSKKNDAQLVIHGDSFGKGRAGPKAVMISWICNSQWSRVMLLQASTSISIPSRCFFWCIYIWIEIT